LLTAPFGWTADRLDQRTENDPEFDALHARFASYLALWHERDISHSSVERVVLPDSAILTDYLLAKTHWLVSGMRVDTGRMRRNLESTKGLVFSGQLLLDLAAAGMLREQAYRLVQEEAMRAWREEGDFQAAMKSHPDVRKLLTEEQIDWAFSAARQLKNVDVIFTRVFSQKKKNSSTS